MVGVQGPREDPLDMIYQPEGQKETRKLPEMTESALAAIEVALMYKNEGLP